VCSLWRIIEKLLHGERDALKKSISMAASAYLSPKELHGKRSKRKTVDA